MQSAANIVQQLSPGAEEAIKAYNPWYWAYSSNIRLVAGYFTLEGHEFQVRPMSVRPPIKVIMKGTQATFTESEVLNVLNGMIYGYYPTGVYYLFPNKDKVSEFSKSRFRPLISDNPDTIGQYVRDTDSATLKRIGSGFLYFRSGRLGQDLRGEMKTSAALKGDPADHAVHDEYDEMHPGIDEFVDGRLSKSPIHTKSYLANPTLPDYGIDKKFQPSSQEYWHIECQHCGKYTCLDLDDNFPALFQRQKDGSVMRTCPHCGLNLDPRFGEWVAGRTSEKDILGFAIGQPSLYWINPKSLLDAWENPDTDKANFIRLKLGKAYIEAENRLDIDQVLDLCGSDGIVNRDTGPCFMGVDQGKDLHTVIGKRYPPKSGKLVHLQIYKDWEDLDGLMKKFNVSRCVVDALPEMRNARAFAERHRGKVFLNYYNEHQKGSYAWNEEELIVQCNRTESLDASHKEIAGQSLVLPKRCQMTEDFAKHLHNVAKKIEEDETTGSRRYIYVKLGTDHFRHAFNYETMARKYGSDSVFAECYD